MCNRERRRIVGIGCISFGVGILLAYLFRGILLTTVVAVVLGAVGILLLKSR